MGVKIKDLPSYGTIITDIAKKDLLEISKNNGTYGTPDYDTTASKKITLEDLKTALNVHDYFIKEVIIINDGGTLEVDKFNAINVTVDSTFVLPTSNANTVGKVIIIQNGTVGKIVTISSVGEVLNYTDEISLVSWKYGSTYGWTVFSKISSDKIAPNIVNVTSSTYNASIGENIKADATGGNIVITLPNNKIIGDTIYCYCYISGSPSSNSVTIGGVVLNQSEFVLLRWNGVVWDVIATNTGISQTDINNSVGKYTGFATVGNVGSIGGNTITFNSGTYYNLAGELTTYATTVITPNWSSGVGRISSVYLDLTDGLIKSQSSPLTLQDHATSLEMVTLTNSSANLVTGYVASWDYIQNAIELETSLNYYAKRKTGLNIVATANTALNLKLGRFFQKGCNLQNDLSQLNWYDITAQTPLSYFISNRNAIESVTPQTLLSAISDSYDLNGTVTTLANNKFQNLRIYGTFDNPSGSVPTILIQRGQTEYASLSDAQKGLNTESYVLNTLNARIFFLGIITVKKGFTATNSLTDCAILNTNDNCQIGGGGGASVDLTNYVTTDTAQTIGSQKTFSAPPIITPATALTPTFFNSVKEFISATGSNFGTWLNSLTAKTTPVDADVITILDSASSFQAKKSTLAQLRSWLGTGLTTNFIPMWDGSKLVNCSLYVENQNTIGYAKSIYAAYELFVASAWRFKIELFNTPLARILSEAPLTIMSNGVMDFKGYNNPMKYSFCKQSTGLPFLVFDELATSIALAPSTGSIATANSATTLDLQSTNKGLGLPLINGNLATTRNGNIWYDTAVHAPKIVNNGVVNELSTYKYDELLQVTDCLNLFSTAYTGVYVPFIPKCDMDVIKIHYNLQSTGTDTVRVAIYSDVANMPTTLLIQSNESITGGTATGLRSISIAKTRLIGGTKYWIAIKNDNGASSFLNKNNVYSNNITRENYIGSGAFVTTPTPTSSTNAVWMAVSI